METKPEPPPTWSAAGTVQRELPLSFAQERLWFLERMLPGTAAYNMPVRFRFKGPVRAEVLAAALTEIVRRHETLRTVFALPPGNDRPVQRVLSPRPVPLPVVDLGSLPAAAGGEEAERIGRKETRRPYDLERGPLLHTVLLFLSGEESLLLIAAHHIASDGWSLGMLADELQALYRAFATDAPSPLPELPIQYGDFAVWQRGRLTGAVLEKHLSYWRERLAGAPGVLELPADRPRPALQTFRGDTARRPGTVPVGAVQRLAREREATPFMVLLAAFQAQLLRITGQEDLLVGLPVANRDRAKIEKLIGFFVNLLALRTDLGGDPGFTGLVARTREASLKAYAHQELPFELLVEALAPDRDLSRTPLVQVTFAQKTVSQSGIDFGPGITADLEDVYTATSKFDLGLYLEEGADGVWLVEAEYSSDLFDAATVDRLLGTFETLLAGALADPEARLSDLPLLSAAERRQTVVDWNQTRTSTPTGVSIHRLFETHVRRDPAAVALTTVDGGEIGYGELNRRANRLAQRLRDLGVGPEVPVALVLERSPEMVVAMLAVLKAGGVYVPLDPSDPPERLRFILEDCGAVVRIGRSPAPYWLASGGGMFLEVEEDGEDAEAGNLTGETDGEGLAYVIYTSGSTGQPKGVGVPHRAVPRVVIDNLYLPFGPGSRVTHLSNTAFDSSVFEVWGGLITGGSVALIPREVALSSVALSAEIDRQGITAMFLTTSLFHQYAAELERGSGPIRKSLRALVFGGEAADPRWALAAHEALGRGVALINGYGPTESTVFATTYTVGDEAREWPAWLASVPIGRPIADTRVHILDAGLRPVPVGVPGELCIGGAGLARGYLARSRLTAERFIPDPFAGETGLDSRPGTRLYRTGDRVRARPDGVLEYLGRFDQQVKVRGFRIEPGEIEAALTGLPGIEAAAVLAREDTPGLKSLAAYVVRAADAGGLDTAGLRARLEERLPAYMVPARFAFVESLPLTPSGKLDRKALAFLAFEEARPAEAAEAPLSPVEEVVAAFWKELLGVEQAGARDNFFEIGGHSLLATSLLARLRAAFGVEIDLVPFLREPTIAGLARRIGEARRERAPLLAAETVAAGDLPLSFGQERLWFLERLAPGTAVYNLPVRFRIRGPVDAGALGTALEEIVQRHEALRTVFALPEGADAPVQRVLPAETVPSLKVVDLAALPETVRDGEARRIEREETRRPFDLETGPLVRMVLVKRTLTPVPSPTRTHARPGEGRPHPSELFSPSPGGRECGWERGAGGEGPGETGIDSSILLVTAHHIASDGWSLAVLARELRALYEGAPLPELPIQYRAFAVWQRGWLASGVLEDQLAWWRERLAGYPGVLELPADRSRPALQSVAGGTVRRLSSARAETVGRLARQHRATPFIVLLAAFQVFLVRITGQEDLVVGSPVAARSRAEIEGLIGFFVNLLALRTDASGDPGFGDLLERTREAALGAYAHQDLPFETLVEAVTPDRDLSRSPLVQVLFTLEGVLPPGLDLAPDVSASLEAVSTGTSKLDLELSFKEEDGGRWALDADYASSLFDEATAERLLAAFDTLLAGALATPEARLSELPLVSEDERRQMIAGEGHTRTSTPTGVPLHRLFETWAARQPEAVAVTTVTGEEIRYGELDQQAGRLACRLRAAGVERGAPVALFLERSPEMVVAMLAVWKAGGAYVPLDPADPPERLRFVLEDSGAAVRVGRGAAPEWLAADGRFVGIEDSSDVGAGLVPAREGELDGDDLAYLLYTSGSTGRPKGVAVPHRAVPRVVIDNLYLEIGPGDRLTHLCNTAFDVSVFEVWGALLNGASLVVIPREVALSPPRLSEEIDRQGATVVFLPTALFHPYAADLEQGGGPKAGSLRALLFAGEAADPRWTFAAREALPAEVALINAYGPTEGTVFATTYAVGKEEFSATVPIGRPIAETHVYLLDTFLRLMPPGLPGELCLGGAGLARGYHSRPDLTAERFVPDPFAAEPGSRLYRTGDRVKARPDGTLDYLGRLDQQVKIRGFRIEPGEIETALTALPGVEAAVVRVREDPPGHRSLAAYVVGAGLDAADLRTRLQERLPAYMVPARFAFVESLPLTPSGKLDRRALSLVSFEEALSAETDGEPPLSPIEEVVAAFWKELLGREHAGVRDNFFEAGGHSLLATSLLARLRSVLGVEIGLVPFFREPTISGLARRIAGARADRAPLLAAGPAEGRHPLSFAQERLWFLERLAPGTPAYNLPVRFRIEGPLDAGALAAALAEIVRRHEALRTVFALPEGADAPGQWILPPASVPGLRVVDLAGLPEPVRDEEAGRIEREETQRPFDLETGPLLRTVLVRELFSPSPGGRECGWERGPGGEGSGEAGANGSSSVLLLTAHHIASDGWSLGVLARELRALYQAAVTGEPSPLPELPIQYREFAVWQRRWLAGGVLDEQLVYWRERLAGYPGVLELPADRPRPALRGFRGGSVGRLSAVPVAAVHQLARRSRATPFIVLLAAFQALLARITGQEDILVGSPVAARNRAEIEGMIGFFINLLALRTETAGDPTFTGLLERTREAALGAYAHQDLPFETLVEAVVQDRDLSRSPLVQVTFTLENAPPSRLDLAPDVTATLETVDTGTAKFDLDLSVKEGEEGVWFVEASYASDLFDAATAERLLALFETLLAGAVAGPEARLSDLPLLSDAERRQLLEEWSRTAPAQKGDSTLHGLFEEHAARDPSAVALVSSAGEVSYGELDRRAERLARRLQNLGVGPEVRVGVGCERSPELIVALLGVLKAGGAYVPLDPEYPEERLRFMLEDSGAPVLVTERHLTDRYPEAPEVARVLLDEGDGGLWETAGPAATAASAASAAHVIYTSGSTGRPKGVVVLHRGVVRLVRSPGVMRFGPDAVWMLLSPVSFDASTLEIWGCLANGRRLVLLPPGKLSPEEIAAAVERHGVTTLHLTTALFPQVVDGALAGLRGVRQLLVGGDVMPPEAAHRFREGLPGCLLVNNYGPTENTVLTTAYPVPAAAPAAIPIGRPLSGTDVYVVGRAFQPVPAGVAGELVTGGAGLARGYHRRPDLTAERFVPHPFGAPGERLYRTGDLARFLPDGNLSFLGRADRQVKVRGFRVEPAEIEAALLRHPAIAEAAVIARRLSQGDESLVGFVVAKGEPAPGSAELRSWLSGTLPSHMVPTMFSVLPALPRTPSDKVDRRALAALAALPLAAQEGEAAEPAAPRTPLEEIVAGFIAGVLNRERVGVRDRFFEIGGHSLLATVLLSRLRAALGVELTLTGFFQEPTAAGLARRIEQARQERQGFAVPALERAPRDRPLRLSFGQERLWLVDQMQPGGSAYNSYLPVVLKGDLDLPRMERVLTEIARRHETLRTTFSQGPDGPIQIIAPPAPWTIPVVDLAGLPEETRNPLRARLATEEVLRPFDLARGPLRRATLLRLDAGWNAVLFNLHHSVCDGWSLEVLTREVGALYRAFATGLPSPLPELPVQYGDYAQWQRGWLQGEVYEAQLEYWRQQIGDRHRGGKPAVLELPTDRPRPRVQTTRGGFVSLALPAERLEDLTALGRRCGGTLFTTLLAAFQLVLGRHAGQERVSVGTPVAGRTRPEIEGLIGFFVNTLVLSADLSGDPPVRQLLERVRDVTLGAFDHQDFPFEKLVAHLETDRDPSRQPLFQVMLVLQNNRALAIDLPGLELGMLPSGSGQTLFDVVLTLEEAKDGMSGILSYNADLFELPTMGRFAGHFLSLAAGMVEDPDRPLSALPFLSEAERQQLLFEWPEAQEAEGRLACVLDSHRRPVPAGVWGELWWTTPGESPETGSATGQRTRYRADGTLERPGSAPEAGLSTPAEGEAARQQAARQAELDQRRRQLSSRRGQLSPERLAVLQKWVKGKPGEGEG